MHLSRNSTIFSQGLEPDIPARAVSQLGIQGLDVVCTVLWAVQWTTHQLTTYSTWRPFHCTGT